MQILREANDLAHYLQGCGDKPKCFVDTGFLYALAYDDDRFFNQANNVFDLLSGRGVFFYTNVISRMEFVDLIFRKQVTQGCIQLFGSIGRQAHGDPIYSLLKDIRDKDTAARRKSNSYKIDESRLKKLRIGRIKGVLGLDLPEFGRPKDSAAPLNGALRAC